MSFEEMAEAAGRAGDSWRQFAREQVAREQVAREKVARDQFAREGGPDLWVPEKAWARARQPDPAPAAGPPVDPAWWNLAALLLILRRRVILAEGRSAIVLPSHVMVLTGRGPAGALRRSPAAAPLAGAVHRAVEAGWARRGTRESPLQLADPGIDLLVLEMTKQGRRAELIAAIAGSSPR